ncbi:MAG: response regulator [Schwartzia sp.]|nr:response regulator [Schwartzia sp. (in: firmicutes)]
MSDSQTNRRLPKIIVQIGALLLILVALAIWMQMRSASMMISSLERTVSDHAAGASLLVDRQFHEELSVLSMAAGCLEPSPGTDAQMRILAELQGKEKGVFVGVMSIDGDTYLGDPLSHQAFQQLASAVHGQEVVDYSAEHGLIFAVPIMRGGNVCGVLYRLYSEALIPQRFRMMNFNPSMRLLLQDRTGRLIMPYRTYSKEDAAFFASKEVRQAFLRLRKELGTQRATATYLKQDGNRYFLFASDLPHSNCMVAGYIPWAAVAGPMDELFSRGIHVAIVLLLIFLSAGAYLVMMREKASRSEALEQEKELANRANEAKSEFLASMSHEIRTPINTMLGLNEMILRKAKDATVANYAQNIRTAGNSLLSIINDILDFSKIESGKFRIVETEYRLSKLVSTVSSMVRPRAEGKRLDFHIKVAPDTPEYLFGDARRIQQILMNLLTNAVKYTERGDVDVLISHAPGPDKDTTTLRFVVRDTGIGIRDEDKAKLFQGFERFDMHRNQQVEGTGLGLAITRNLVDMMKGSISFESVYGEGTTFTVTLPQTVTAPTPIGEYSEADGLEAQAEYHVSFIAPKAEVLAADDNEMNRFVLAELLKDTQIKLETVANGEEALERLLVKRYDAVLLDQRMGGMSGVETLRAASRLPNSFGTPFLVLTADADVGARERFLQEGFADYLSKPLDYSMLERALMRHLPPEKVLPAPELESPAPEPPKAPAPVSAPPPEETGETPVYDHAAALRYSAGNEKIFHKLAQVFTGLHEKKSQQLRELLSSENWDAYTDAVHSLKSTSLSVGGLRLSEAAKASEMAGKRFLESDSPEEKEKALAEIRENHENVLRLYGEFVAALKAEL